MEQMSLRNLSNQPKTVYVSGKPITLPPYAEDFFDATIGRLFLEEHAPVVERIDLSANTVAENKIAKSTLWLANMSGNEGLPEKVKVRYYDKVQKTEAVREIDNPLRVVKTVMQTWKGSDELYVDSHGFGQSKSNPSTEVIIPPYRRIEMPIHQAMWLLNRDGNNHPTERNMVIESRAPSDFEPNMSWDLDLIRAYYQWLMPLATTKDLGPNLAKVKKDHSGGAVEKETQRYKLTLLRKLYFLVVNPAVKLPTKSQLDEFLGKGETSTYTPDAAEALVAKAWKDSNPTVSTTA